MTTTPVWINGVLRSPDDAVIAYDDHGITVGDGVFETLKVVDEQPFALTRHLRRLAASAAAMEIPLPADETIRLGIEQVLATHRGPGFLRLTVTAGPGPLGTPRADLAPTLVIAIRPGEIRTEPTDVITVPWPRNERGALAGVKSTSYGENVIALQRAARRGATEAIFANTHGDLCEGTGSNIFLERQGRLVTPSLRSGCLAGVTRELLLEAGVGEEADVSMADLGTAAEMFLVSTGREVQPIRTVDGRSIGRCPGPLTIAARERWDAEIADQIDP